MLDLDQVPDFGRSAVRKPTIVQEALVHVDLLHHLAWYVTGNGTDAEALVHATFARAFGAAEGVAAGTSLKTWLCRILGNTFVTEWRGSHRAAGTAEEPDEPVGEADAPEGEVLREVIPDDLQAAIMMLPEEERMAILLDLEGLSEDDLAYALGCMAHSVPGRIARSRAALRRRLAEIRDGAP
jgi:RNA polymerase sigma-70 factor (ECF subfamily)